MDGVIKEGALFIADAHYPHHGDAFLLLLKRLDKGDISTPQLFLMGDIFDLLFGYNDYIQTFSSEAITLLNSLSKTIEIHYFEGNHDFLLEHIFPNIKIYSRDLQPAYFDLNGERAALSHGDKYALGWRYDLYCALQRNRWLFILLRPLGKRLIDSQLFKLKKKKICKAMTGFEKRVEEIAAYYDKADLIVEGHYHEGKTIGKYVSLPSLACQKKIAVVRNGKIVFEDFQH